MKEEGSKGLPFFANWTHQRVEPKRVAVRQTQFRLMRPGPKLATNKGTVHRGPACSLRVVAELAKSSPYADLGSSQTRSILISPQMKREGNPASNKKERNGDWPDIRK